MTQLKVELSDIRYDPASQEFEALVSFHEGHDVTRVPCALRLPIQTDYAAVAEALTRQARIRRRIQTDQLLSHFSARGTVPKRRPMH